MVTIGVISDTHKLLRPEVVSYLQNSDLIIHAGDIGAPDIITRLSDIAPVTAIRGNIDKARWAEMYPIEDTLIVGNRLIHIVHNVRDMGFDPHKEGYDVVISGHSHQPRVKREHGVLYINPGSAGPRRFSLPIAVAKLFLTSRSLRTRIMKFKPQ